MLPLVRAIVKGMLDDHAERRSHLERLEAGGMPAAAEATLRREVEALTEKLVEAVEELEDLGVEFKGIELGLVDFPSLRDGRIVYLCWRFDEDRIRHWHPLDAGYAGRRPLDPD